jgi:hypothetical protein
MSKKLKAEIERLKDKLDAAYDAHAGSCASCCFRWKELRKQRAAEDK